MGMTEELAAAGPWPGHEQEMDLYGRLVGTWDVTNRYFVEEKDEWVHGTVVWTFGWALGGHTVQDVMWFTGPGADGYPRRDTGSTVRHYNPAGKTWAIVWFSPLGRVTKLTGRAADDGGIVQEGTQTDGRPIRWLFTEVTAESFRWLGYISDDEGETWRLEQEMLAKRR
ncbi:hypothetical protein [Paractinoplanes globisporus]|uniref:DUF1579 domain-containing protein n=1 Tax=Paractinoplanes globisporus TaxID=113565 RepID=A0ABW6WC07_9ACTN|nr:hypothetical protein [Actinoplanes globisporus]